MENRKTLVVFHTSSGNTGKVARTIAQALSADLEQIQEVNPHPVDIKGQGLGNFLNMGRAVFAALTKRSVPIHDAQHDPGGYDLVVIGTPVYAHAMAAPVRTYIEQHCARLGETEVAFFCTGEDPQNEGFFPQMEKACGKAPAATFAFHAPKIKADEFTPQVEAFVAQL